jgi:hypothetical protein
VWFTLRDPFADVDEHHAKTFHQMMMMMMAAAPNFILQLYSMNNTLGYILGQIHFRPNKIKRR